MKPASRSMPRLERKPTLPWVGRLCFAGLGAAVLWALWAHLIAVCASVVVLWCLAVISRQWEQWHLAPLVQARAGQSLCDFARSIDCRRVDTWVVRAVYEELPHYLSSGAPLPLPLRVTDRLKEDLRLHADDVDDIAVDVALRTGRNLASTDANPFFGKVATVGDLVEFLNAQPRPAAG